MDIKDIKSIVELMEENSISELEIEKKDFKIRLRRGHGDNAEGPFYANYSPQHLLGGAQHPGMPPHPTALPPQSAPESAPADTSNEAAIKSPMIGTFYRAPSPESGPYVEVGTAVEPDTVVCIIEAMKVMNEIKAEAKGVVTELLVENGKPVEFDQPLFKIKPA